MTISNYGRTSAKECFIVPNSLPTNQLARAIFLEIYHNFFDLTHLFLDQTECSNPCVHEEPTGDQSRQQSETLFPWIENWNLYLNFGRGPDAKELLEAQFSLRGLKSTPELEFWMVLPGKSAQNSSSGGFCYDGGIKGHEASLSVLCADAMHLNLQCISNLLWT